MKCIVKRFQQNFKDWTNAIEWLLYERVYDTKYIAKGRFGKVYKANWVDGSIDKWDDQNENWKRNGNIFITSHHKLTYGFNFGIGTINFHGIAQNPETKNYMMILDYAEIGSLRNYLDKNCNELSWYNKIECLCFIAYGLENIHDNEINHRDLHVVYGLPYIAPEIVRGQNYTKASDVYNYVISANKIHGILYQLMVEIQTELQEQIEEAFQQVVPFN
ncbi:kinase-like domain-containing protein [Rhizophagus clarus]|uniref:Kinase-like domain-containing protein n=1 Tax=Rhizophagus clarus TaxID=94130 RepID=A0A8H3LFP9_9GLOM|nr:kinase-like domain-containing protein [Rhizophagus clarus]